MAQGVKWDINAEELEKLTEEFTDEEIAAAKGIALSTLWTKRKELGIFSYREKTENKKNRKTGEALRPGTGTPHHTTRGQNETFFDVIDTEEKAYFLGLLLAEGHTADNTSGCYISLSLSGDDTYMVARFRELLKANQKTVLSQRSGKKKEAEQRFYSRHLVERLLELGVTKNTEEHFIALPEEIPCTLRRHLIRGVVDGDGHIGADKSAFNIGSCSKELLEGIKAWLEEELGIQPHINEPSILPSGKLFWHLIPGDGNPLGVLSWLYDNSNIYLERKRHADCDWSPRVAHNILKKQEADPLREHTAELEELARQKIAGEIKRGAQQRLAELAKTNKSVVSERLKKLVAEMTTQSQSLT